MLILIVFRFGFEWQNLQGVAGFPVVDAAAGFEMEEEKETSKFLINNSSTSDATKINFIDIVVRHFI